MTPAMFDAILADISTHGNVCQAVRDHKQHINQFYREKNKTPERMKAYILAKQNGMHAFADEMVDLVDKCGKGGADKVRLQVDVRKFLLAKMLPKEFGEKVQLSGDPEQPLVMTWAPAKS